MRSTTRVIRAAAISTVVGLAGNVQLNAQPQPTAPRIIQSQSDSSYEPADVRKFAYEANCAVCHGMQGAGQDREPYWNYLNKEIPSLVDLSVKNGGSFPFAKVYEFIDGRHEQMARGPRDMPIWGAKFKAESVGLNSAYDSEAFARAKLLALTEYVYRLQRTEGAGKKLSCRAGAISFVTGFETPAEYYRLQNAANYGDSPCQSSSIEFVSEFENPYEEAVRAASSGISSLTREQPTADAAYLTAHVELVDGREHPAFGTAEQQMIIYKMPSGKLVLRIVNGPPEWYWPGAH